MRNVFRNVPVIIACVETYIETEDIKKPGRVMVHWLKEYFASNKMYQYVIKTITREEAEFYLDRMRLKKIPLASIIDFDATLTSKKYTIFTR